MDKAEEILDKHLENRGWTKTVPKYGNLYNMLLDAVSEALTIPPVVGQSEQLKAFADWLQSDTANLNYDFRDLVDEYLKSL